MRRSPIPLHLLVLGMITAGAAALRLVDLGTVRLDPFYDAAVRSMGLSWHNFLLGAYEPGGSASIDKPPLDLWLAVGSVKLFGWSSTTLKLPQALAGTAAVPLLYAALRRPFGVAAGLSAALAMAVLPIDVVSARSDTMDAVMMMLLVLALLALVRACENGRAAWLAAAGVALGLAFNVKLLESLVALPGLFLLAWLGMPRATRYDAAERARPLGARALVLASAGALYIAVALSWLTLTLLFAADTRPWAIGSTNGSAWNAAFVFNGLDRLTGKVVEGGHVTPPSPTRLLARSGPLPASWLGWVALAALVLGAIVLVSLWRSRESRVRRATAVGLYVWLVTGVVLFSAMARLHPRYVESFTPAVAGVFGIGVAWLAGLPGRRRILALAPLALLALPLHASVRAIQTRASDAGEIGALHPSEQRALSAYLGTHGGATRYELAAGSATSVASLIVEDVRPVLMLTTYEGRALTGVARLKRLISLGQVRYAFLSSTCDPHAPTPSAGCAPAALWIRAHGVDVSRRAGMPRPGTLWRLPGVVG